LTETVSAAAVVPTAAPVKVDVPSTRRRRGVVIRDPEEESSVKTPTKTKSKDKGKGIMVEEPKPMKKKQQVELDETYARKLQEELNQDIDWEVAMDHVKQNAKENPYVQRNEDTIFDPGIANHHFPSLLPDVSHRCETFMKFNVYLKLLNESLMEILSSSCSPMEQ
nr:hypothetical protein [Tanacetum cinerariifolium]